MALSLDLAGPEEKLTRAFTHLESLNEEVAKMASERPPYGIRISEIEPDTGWCWLYLTPQSFNEPTLGVILGDLIHNLRCTLDYIVTSLVAKCGAILKPKHQFPIFASADDYRRSVGDATHAKPDGMLGGITHGLGLFWDLQPFNASPDPEENLLFFVNRFSNADKHRITASFAPIPNHLHFDFDYSGTITEQVVFEKMEGEWQPNVEYKVAGFRFAEPYASQPYGDARITLNIMFRTPPFGRYKRGHGIESAVVGEMCGHVWSVLEQFRALGILLAHSAALSGAWILWQVYNCPQV